MEKMGTRAEEAEVLSPAGLEPRDRSARRSKEQKRLEAEARNRLYRETQELRRKIREVESNLERTNQEMESMANRL